MSAASRIESLLAPLGIEAGFCARHLALGAEVAINASALFPTASVFKVPVMVEVYRRAEAGDFALDDRIAMTEAVRTMGSGVFKTLAAGIAPTIRDLVMLMTVISDNTATCMLLDLVGPARVTATMRALGLRDIHVTLSMPKLFAHAYGLPPEPPLGYQAMVELMRGRTVDYSDLTFARTPANTTSSATDMAALMAMIALNQAASAESCADMLTVLRAQQLRERIPRYLPPSATANKTGSFVGVRNDAGLIFRGAEDVIAFAIFTFDPTPIMVEDHFLVYQRTRLVADAMAEIGKALWTDFV